MQLELNYNYQVYWLVLMFELLFINITNVGEIKYSSVNMSFTVIS